MKLQNYNKVYNFIFSINLLYSSVFFSAPSLCIYFTTAFPNPDPKRNRNSSDVAGGGTLRAALLRGGKLFTR